MSDLHLTPSEDAAHRWGLFPWLIRECEIEEVQTVFILGDLTDAKDYHPAEFVNKVAQSVASLAARVPLVVILMGNHDYLKGGHAFFEFLGLLPNVKFITKPEELVVAADVNALLLPHDRNPSQSWKGMDFSHFNLLLMHQTVKGAVASNGQHMDGEPLPSLDGLTVYSGDIHVPQVVGSVTYVGSPYHVHYGDSFTPRCLLLDRKCRPHDLHFPAPKRLSLRIEHPEDLRGAGLSSGDQVKVTLCLRESSKHEWHTHRRAVVSWLQAHDVHCAGVSLDLVKSDRRLATTGGPPIVSDRSLLVRFVERHELGPEALDIGLDFLP